MKPRVFCRRGHLLYGENVKWSLDGRGQRARECLTCRRYRRMVRMRMRRGCRLNNLPPWPGPTTPTQLVRAVAGGAGVHFLVRGVNKKRLAEGQLPLSVYEVVVGIAKQRIQEDLDKRRRRS